jgi:hypothetical protein
MSEKPKQRVLVEVTIGAPIDAVWTAVRDPEQIAKWFGWDAETLKDEIDFIFLSHATADATTHTIVFGEWEGFSYGFELEPSGKDTVLRVVRSAPAGDVGWDDVYEEIVEGWITFVQQLRLWLERHKGEKRRTLYLSGQSVAGQALPSVVLGLDGLRNSADGSAYALETPSGEALSGVIWHRSKFQLGIGVSQWGDGLLVVTDRPAGDGAPNGGGSAVLTTYGMSEKAFGALSRRWSAWWVDRYPQAKPGG